MCLSSQVQSAGRLDEPAARWFFQQLIIALDYCHRKGAVKPAIFNRDIKLENILLETVPGSLPLVKICDFGYSKNELVSGPKSKVRGLSGTCAVVLVVQVVQLRWPEGTQVGHLLSPPSFHCRLACLYTWPQSWSEA